MESKQVQALLQLTENNPAAIVRAYFRDPDGNPLELAPYQEEFIKTVLSRKKDRITFLAATRAGKSEAISVAIALLALFYPRERIVNISYTDVQAKIIFERVKAHLVEDSPVIRSYVDVGKTLGTHKEFSKERMFMKNGTDIRIFSTGTGTTNSAGESLLGFGASILVIDESGSIPDEVYSTKIVRMLGSARSNGLNSMLIELGTPHQRNHFYEAFRSPRYTVFHVDWKKAVDAGRMTPEFVEEQRERLTPLQFSMWYGAEFPSISDDGVFDEHEIERNYIEPSSEFLGERVLSVDVARMGRDWTVLTELDLVDDMVFQRSITAYNKKDLMETTGWIVAKHKEKQYARIFVDDVGMGGGVVDRLRELGVPVVPVLAGNPPQSSNGHKTCANIKAEVYLKAKKMFEQNKLKVIHRHELVRDLMAIRQTFTSTGLTRIVDPDKSPDFSDALVYGLISPPSYRMLEDKDGVIF